MLLPRTVHSRLYPRIKFKCKKNKENPNANRRHAMTGHDNIPLLWATRMWRWASRKGVDVLRRGFLEGVTPFVFNTYPSRAPGVDTHILAAVEVCHAIANAKKKL